MQKISRGGLAVGPRDAHELQFRIRLAVKGPTDFCQRVANVSNLNPRPSETVRRWPLADDANSAPFHHGVDKQVPVGVLTLDGKKETSRRYSARIIHQSANPQPGAAVALKNVRIAQQRFKNHVSFSVYNRCFATVIPVGG